jgi:hypothetical protein
MNCTFKKIVSSLTFQFVLSKIKDELRKTQQQQQQQKEEYVIVDLKDGRVGPMALTFLLSFYYQMPETCSHLVVTVCRSG